VEKTATRRLLWHKKQRCGTLNRKIKTSRTISSSSKNIICNIKAKNKESALLFIASCYICATIYRYYLIYHRSQLFCVSFPKNVTRSALLLRTSRHRSSSVCLTFSAHSQASAFRVLRSPRCVSRKPKSSVLLSKKRLVDARLYLA